MKFLNKTDLIKGMVSKSGLTKRDAGVALSALLDTITDTLSKKQGVRLVDFGSFKVNHRKARMGRNPQSGKKLKISARDVPAFKAGKGLKDKVNK